MASQWTMPQFAARDLALVVAVALTWQWLAPVSAVPGPAGDFVGLLLGALVALCLHLAHEWGHYAGAHFAGSVTTPGQNWKALFIFSFDSVRNDKRQFLWMSATGFVATALVAWFAFTQLPVDYLASRIARGFAVLQVVLALVIEVPLVIWALVGKRLPPVDRGPGRAVAAR